MINWKRDFVPHPSHTMMEYKMTVRTPASTPRFYDVRSCKNCELEMGISVAGEYYEIGLESQCELAEETDAATR